MLICVQLLLTSVDTVFKMPKIFVKKKYEVYMINKTAILSLILFFIVLSTNVIAQAGHGIERLSLDGSWEVIYDDKNIGIDEKWHLNENFDKLTHKKTISVPSTLESFNENYEGVAFYRKTFTIPEHWDNQIIELQFDAVNYKSEIWINDEVVGFHEGGYTPFSFRIDQLIDLNKENSIIVRVITPIILTDKNIDGLGRQEVPMWRGAINGGIWQSVSLLRKRFIHLKDVFIETDIDNKTLEVNLEIYNHEISPIEASLELEVFNQGEAQVVSKSKSLTLSPGKTQTNYLLKFDNIQLWDVDNPNLYELKIILKQKEKISDQWRHKFGFREFTVQNDEFYLNGKPIYLKAAFFEGLYPVGMAYPDSREMAIKEIKLAKEAGFNMIRPWRKPPPKMWLELCDELGVLVVGSLVVECMYRPISTPRLPFVVENELKKTILNNRNRTSIVQWELFNEINRPILTQMLNEMSVLARELDPSRMILDESGGWGEGANIYLPYETTPTKFNDIHHYSGSQVNQMEFDGYLVTGKTQSEKKQLKLSKVKGYGKNVVPGIMSYISELGYGSTPNLVQNNITFKEKGNPILAPTVYHKFLDQGFHSVLKKIEFDGIYQNTELLYLEQQKMHGIANKRMIEASRLNSSIKGYCIHALVGGDWVLGAGLLDLWRNPKTLAYDMTKAANQPTVAPIRILPRNVFKNQGFNLKVYGVNENNHSDVKAVISIKDSLDNIVFSETSISDLDRGINVLFDKKLSSLKMNGSYKVHAVILDKKGNAITENSESFDVFDNESYQLPKELFALHDPKGDLTNFLVSKKINFIPFTPALDVDIPVIVGQSENKKQYAEDAEMIQNHVNKGGYAVFLEVKGKPTKNFDRVLKEIPQQGLPTNAQMLGKWPTLGGWAAKSHIIKKHPIFEGLPTNQIMHGVYENIHPITSMAKQEGVYIVGMIGYDHFPNNDIMLRHYNGPGEVWWAADVLESDHGKGQMLLSTLRIIENLGKDPVAEKILMNIISYSLSKN